MHARDGLRWSLWLAQDEAAAAYPEQQRLRTRCPATAGTGTGSFRAVVELHRAMGGIAPRALLGGELTIRPVDGLDVEIRHAAEDYQGESFAGPSGQPYRSGLLPEDAGAVLDRCNRDLADGQLLAGILVLDRAGQYRESSPLHFAEAAAVLIRVLDAQSRGADGFAAGESYLRQRFSRVTG